MAMSWARTGETPRKVAFHFTRELDAIDLRAATESDERNHPDRVFTVSELGDLWLTLQNSGFNIRSGRVFLTGDKLGDDGKPLPILPEITVEGKNGKEYGYAYTAKQVKEFGVPKNLHLMAGYRGAPLLIVGKLPYERKARSGSTRQTPTVQRMTAKPAGEPNVQRQRQRG